MLTDDTWDSAMEYSYMYTKLIVKRRKIMAIDYRARISVLVKSVFEPIVFLLGKYRHRFAQTVF